MGVQLKIGGKFHLKLNMGERPIANKYREGKMKSTLKRELKALEIVKREAIGISRLQQCSISLFGSVGNGQWMSVPLCASSVDCLDISKWVHLGVVFACQRGSGSW